MFQKIYAKRGNLHVNPRVHYLKFFVDHPIMFCSGKMHIKSGTTERLFQKRISSGELFVHLMFLLRFAVEAASCYQLTESFHLKLEEDLIKI